MPEAKRISPFQIRLSSDDQMRFEAACLKSKKSRTDVAREAIKFWLDHKDATEKAVQESQIEQRLSKMEDHMAGLLVKLGIDVNTLYFMLWDRSDPQTRMPLWEAYRTKATERFCKPLKGRDKEAKQVVADHISGEE
jgi:hypothetical protein